MIEDRKVFALWKHLRTGMPLWKAAARSGMDEKTARKYRDAKKLPSADATAHAWRTRPDPFSDVWPTIHELLEEHSELEAKTLFAWLQREHPGKYQDGQLRTFQRGVKAWRATRGPAKEVYFSQVHHPGRLCASDFTHMNSLEVTILGQPFEHMVYHFVLTYSNWEWASICFSESFESLSEGLQDALWELGGVPERHRTDRMSAAVNNLSTDKEFTARYEALMNHYDLVREKIQARKANENGDVESLHGHFKKAVDQTLMLRGSRDFASREAYAQFLRELLHQKNLGRTARWNEERRLLRPLPGSRQEGCKRLRVRVNASSVIHVARNTYSLDSRLIGEHVWVDVHAEHLDVRYGQRHVERLPRLYGRNKRRINYRHVIDSLVRKPGAFENYRYRDELFPTSRFRMAYDAMLSQCRNTASKEYLRVLELAAKESESAVDDALRVLLDEEQPLTADAVKAFLARDEAVPSVTEVKVEAMDLSVFDELFDDKEVCHGFDHGCQDTPEWSLTGASFADVPGGL